MMSPNETDAVTGNALTNLAPVPEIHFQLSEPKDASDYPYSTDSPAPSAPAPGSKVYLSAMGSADPEGMAVEVFWNVQEPSAAYLAIEPTPTAWQAAFTPSRAGVYSVSLQVTELSGLRQTGQVRLELVVAPEPCAADGVSPPCSDALRVPGGTFLMGSADGQGHESERPQHSVTVAPFELDKYEVTVGRFRRFLVDYDPGNTLEGDGAHPLVVGSGWSVDWLFNLPASSDEFMFAISECGGPWTDEIGDNEARPISCITWFEAFAFCAAEGKRLPTEAEWEYAAAGGEEQRPYPWGNDPPSIELAVFGCVFDGEPGCSDADLPVAGSLPGGAGRYGQVDLAGSLWEWTLDVYAPYSATACETCAVLGAEDDPRVFRGGDFKFDDPESLRSTTRYAFAPAFPDQTRGLRCARSVDTSR